MPTNPSAPLFTKVLVANRGEIAIRVLRALSDLRIGTMAVYSYEDRYSLHRYKADEAYMIGDESEPLKPYLDIEALISVAQRKGAQAIHPGYGFLSENVEFATRCREEGIVFIGPSPEVMYQLGDKVRAKEVARAAGVPLIPDSQKPLNKLADAVTEAERIGYPMMMKAAAGGGGRGMRVIHNEEDLGKAFFEARNEAKNAFGDDTVFLEKFVENPKHIEVQLLGDSHGNLVHLCERDCSVQRRFQKVVEQAPSTLPQEIREQLFDYALRIGRQVGYNNAGTVEFLVDGEQNIYFIEVNPRIQVEHTVTEVVTGVDIVCAQVRIAAGARLTDPEIDLSEQALIVSRGFAVQCRITTEDPEQDFKPDYGRIIAYRSAVGPGIRLDGGSIYPGMKISPFFDSMLVKITGSGRTLEDATQRIDRALREFRIRGVKTNIQFLRNVVNHPIFQAGQATVGFLQAHPELFEIQRGYDRGTKTLRYLGNLLVNGNPDVKFAVPREKFRQPVVPPFNRNHDYPQGTRDKLKELGREGFTQWLKGEPQIQYTDTTFRDAHQSLLATRMRTYDLFEVAESYARNHPGTFSMEMWGGATFDVCLRFLKESPWKRLQLLREKMPNLLFQMLLRGSNAVGYTAYPDNLVQRFIVEAAKNGIDLFRIFDSLNWLEAMKVSIRTVREETDALAEACLCYTGDISNPQRSKYDLQYYVDLARRLEDEGAHMLAIKDMAGLLKPLAADKLVRALKEHLDIPIHLHTHDTSGNQLTTYLKAVEAGVDVIDLAIASMSGLTSQPNFNSFVAAMQGHERENQQVDLSVLNGFANYFEVVREYYYPFESELRAGTAEVYEHEIPGGQYSNLLPQARSLGLEDKFEQIKRNYATVNHMFGDIVKVTPSSKVVGDMALFMTSNDLTEQEIFERGEELSFPDSVKNFFRGDLGQPYGGFPEQLQRIVLKGEPPYTDRPNAHLAPVDFDKAWREFQQDFPDPRLDFLDFLSYQLYPKVFEEYYAHLQAYDEVIKLPTPAFFYPLKPDQEILVRIDPGKKLLIEFMYMLDADEEGRRPVYFKINGQTRAVFIRDENVTVEKLANRKAKEPNEIGSPLQGRLTKVLVEPGDKVKKNQPLFTIEAMKMESTITANGEGVVKAVHLKGGDMVESEDLVVEMA
jgi:pyruvate carboxylase